MSEDELAGHLAALLGDEEDDETGGDATDDDNAANLLEKQLPETIDADVFIDSVVRLSSCTAENAPISVGSRPLSRPASRQTVASHVNT